jgi:hypothetical protein
MAEPAVVSPPSGRVATLMGQPHGDLSEAAEQLAALMAAASAELLDVIRAIDRKESWRDDGATSTVGWVVALLGVSYATAKEWVRVARALDQLPHVREAFSAGMLSWDQIRHATVFVTAADDEEAARELPGCTAAQLEERAKFHRRRTPADARESARQRFFGWYKDRDAGGYRYRGFLPADAGAIVNAAIEERARLMGKDPITGDWDPLDRRCADALVDLARTDVLTHPGPDPTVVVVHVDADVIDGIADGNGSINSIPIPADSVRRLLCDCDIEYNVEGPDGTCIGIGRAGRTPPRWLRRRATHRDGTCRFPGCGRRIRHLHHIQHWTNHGPTDSHNLCGLCWEHHHLVHEGGWAIEGNADAELTFSSPHGRQLRSKPRTLDPAVRGRAQDATGADLGTDRHELRPTGTGPPR